MQLLHTCIYSSFCQPIAGLLCSQCPAMPFPHASIGTCIAALQISSAELTLPKKVVTLIYLSLLLVVMQLSSHDLVLATSGQSEVWIGGVGLW